MISLKKPEGSRASLTDVGAAAAAAPLLTGDALMVVYALLFSFLLLVSIVEGGLS
jgi:hypothetical protein